MNKRERWSVLNDVLICLPHWESQQLTNFQIDDLRKTAQLLRPEFERAVEHEDASALHGMTAMSQKIAAIGMVSMGVEIRDSRLRLQYLWELAAATSLGARANALAEGAAFAIMGEALELAEALWNEACDKLEEACDTLAHAFAL